MTQEYSCSLLKASNYLSIHQNTMKRNNKKGLLQTAAVLQSICTWKGLMWPKDPGFKQGGDTEGAQGTGRKEGEATQSISPGSEVLTASRRNIKGLTTQGKKTLKLGIPPCTELQQQSLVISQKTPALTQST